MIIASRGYSHDNIDKITDSENNTSNIRLTTLFTKSVKGSSLSVITGTSSKKSILTLFKNKSSKVWYNFKSDHIFITKFY